MEELKIGDKLTKFKTTHGETKMHSIVEIVGTPSTTKGIFKIPEMYKLSNNDYIFANTLQPPCFDSWNGAYYKLTTAAHIKEFELDKVE